MSQAKTETPTPQRIQRSRREDRAPQSTLLTTTLVFGAFVLGLRFLATPLFKAWHQHVQHLLIQQASTSNTITTVTPHHLLLSLRTTLFVFAALLLLLLGTSALTSLLQTRFQWRTLSQQRHTFPQKPPLRQRTLQSFWHLFLVLVCLGFATWFVRHTLANTLQDTLTLHTHLLRSYATLFYTFGLYFLACLIPLACIDLVYQHVQHRRALQMTPAEKAREQRETQVHPAVHREQQQQQQRQQPKQHQVQ